LAKITKERRKRFLVRCELKAENRGFPPFPQFGTPCAMLCSSADWPPDHYFRGTTMTAFSTFTRHAMAAVAAVFISGLLMVNSLSVSAHEVHSVAGILA